MSPKRRPRSWWLSFLERTNVTVTALTALAILSTRSAGVVYFGAGGLMTALSVKLVIKRIIRQPRPSLGGKKTYGMPSTHTATMAYYATFITLAAIYLPLHPSLPALARASPVVVLPWAALVATSRVLLGHHTWAQIAAGCGCGITFAGVWLLLWTHGLDEYGRWGEELANSFLRGVAQRVTIINLGEY